MQNGASKINQAIFALPCKMRLLLTGTPALNRPVELFTQIRAVDPRVFPSFEEYALRYCASKPSPFGSGWDDSG